MDLKDDNLKAASAALEEERQRLQCTMKKAMHSEDTVGEIPPMRGVRRLKSSNPNISRVSSLQQRSPADGLSSSSVRNNPSRPSAPTKSTDAAASLRGSAVARANSSRNLLRATSSSSGLRGATRTSSSQGLRPYQPPLVNTSIRKPAAADGLLNLHIRGPGGTLQRNESEMSLGEFSISDGSFFTTDSVNIRKAQLVADPLEHGGSYDDDDEEDDSFADHESFMTRDSDAHIFYEVPNRVMAAPPMTLSDLAALKMNRLQISNGAADDISLASCGTMASGLTTDYTDHDYSEFACDEAEYAE